MTLRAEGEDLTVGKTPIQEFYSGQNILISGGTGFLGKLLIEKLLRECPDLSQIYLIIRPKKGQDTESRLEALFDDPVFERVKKQEPKFRHKVSFVAGDCSLPAIGISQADRDMIARNISIVFHVAATVKFDEKIKQAVSINVNGTKEMMDLCRTIRNLKVVIHVSTAFSNCNRKEVTHERFYEPPMTGDSIIKLTQCVDEKKLDNITESLVGDFPNTYTYTKCIAEQVVQQYGNGLPCGIFRPAIVISAYREPLAGWIDNIYGTTGALVGGGAGLIRALNLDKSCPAEVVPADLTVNALIASAWDVANNKNEDADPPIFNYSATWNKLFTWGDYIDLAIAYGKKAPSIRSIWCYSVTLTKSALLYYFLTIFLHTIPALLMDAGLFVMGKERRMLAIYKKIHKFCKITSYFGLNKWYFDNTNTQALWAKLSAEDKERFNFSMQDFDWPDYMEKCIAGLRIYIFKDDPKTIPEARKRMHKIVLAHKFIKYSIIAFFVWVLYKLLAVSYNSIGAFTTLNDNIAIR